MGCRPSVYFVVAVALEAEGQEISDPRWKRLPEDWENMPVFGPTDEQKTAALAAHVTDIENEEKFRRGMYLSEAHAAFTQSTDKVGDLLVRDIEGYSISGIVGLILSDLPYNNDCLWALAAIYPRYHSCCSFTEIPLLDPEDDCSIQACWWKLAQEEAVVPYPLMVESYQRQLDDGHNYTTFYHEVGGYVDRGLWFFNEILKFGLERRDLRLGLMWIWG